eukprot:scaffold442_cov397-Prasinococcus_capsulatus_cf.AAC.38
MLSCSPWGDLLASCCTPAVETGPDVMWPHATYCMRTRLYLGSPVVYPWVVVESGLSQVEEVEYKLVGIAKCQCSLEDKPGITQLATQPRSGAAAHTLLDQLLMLCTDDAGSAALQLTASIVSFRRSFRRRRLTFHASGISALSVAGASITSGTCVPLCAKRTPWMCRSPLAMYRYNNTSSTPSADGGALIRLETVCLLPLPGATSLIGASRVTSSLV